MNSLLQAFSNYTGIAIEYDCTVQGAGKEDVHTAASFVPTVAPAVVPAVAPAVVPAVAPVVAPAVAPVAEPSKTTEVSTNTEPATLELRIQSLEEQVKALLARIAILEQPK
jgi:hypothetical protein